MMHFLFIPERVGLYLLFVSTCYTASSNKAMLITAYPHLVIKLQGVLEA